SPRPEDVSRTPVAACAMRTSQTARGVQHGQPRNVPSGERTMERCSRRPHRFQPSWRRATIAACGIIAASLLCCPPSSNAQSNFYVNKTVTLVVGASVGGGYDVYARAF